MSDGENKKAETGLKVSEQYRLAYNSFTLDFCSKFKVHTTSEQLFQVVTYGVGLYIPKYILWLRFFVRKY